MAITVNGVTGKEMWDSFRKGRADGGPFVELSYLVPFASADQFTDGVMGGISTAGGTVKNIPKLKCPTNPKLYATSADYRGVGEANVTSAGRPEFQQALVTVHFDIPNWPQFPSDDPGGQQSFDGPVPGQPIIFAECEIDMASEQVTMPDGAFMFVSDSKVLNIPVLKHVPVTTFRIIRHYFPYLPTTKVSSLMNKVNNNDPFLGRTRGQVRFAGARTKQVKTSEGTRTQMWEMVFEVKDRDWNDFIRPDTGKFDTVCGKTDTTYTPYSYADLSPLLS